MTKKCSDRPIGVRLVRVAWLVATVALLVIGFQPAVAQESTGTVTGIVTTPAGEPVVGAEVTLMGRTTLTDGTGRFRFGNVAPGEHDLRVASLGYRAATQTVRVTAGEVATVEFRIQVSAVALDEIVVTGLATGTARRAIGTSVASIDATALEASPVKNLSQMLQGRAPGVHVLPGGGKAGQGSRIVLRGAASVTQANEPLIYVDGVRMDNASVSGGDNPSPSICVGCGVSWSGLDDISPEDIDRIEIVRGASAATLYGTEAAAGVIQIFTKRGREGRAVWNYSGEAGMLSTPLSWWDISEYAPWFYDNMVQRGHLQSHQLSVRGGGENFDFFASGTIRDETGILPNSGEDHYALRLNTGIRPRENLSVRLNTSFNRRSVQHVPDANNTRGYTINGLVGGPRGQFVETLTLTAIESFQEGNRYTGGLTVEHNPMGFLSHRATLGADILNSDEYHLFPFGAISDIPLGYRGNYRRENRNLNVDYVATARVDLTPSILSNTSAGFQWFGRTASSSTLRGHDFPFYGLSTISATLRREALETRVQEKIAGFFVEQQLGYRDFLFATVGARADGHSAFGADVAYQTYPKADVSYVVSEHLSLPRQLSTVRLRGAYGTAGQQPANFAAVRSWSTVPALGGQPAVVPTNLGNPDLRPEVTRELELGFELGFLEDRLHLDVTRYTQRTKDALYEEREPPSLGVLSPQLRNIGEIRNEGWEVGFRGMVFERRGFQWSGLVNYSANENEIVSLGGGSPIQLQWLQWHRESYPVGSFFGDRPIEHNGEVGLASQLLCELGATPVNAQHNCTVGGMAGALPVGWDYIGPPLPTRTLQLGSTFNIGARSSLGFLMDHRGGAYAMSSTMRWLMSPNRNITQAHLDANAALGYPIDTTPGPVARVCRDAADAANPTIEQQKYLVACGRNSLLGHGEFAMPTDFWKLREVTFSYRLPEAIPGRFGVNAATVTVAGRNLWRSTDYIGLEPEGMYRGDLSDSALRNQIFFDTPIPRQITVGVRAQF
jgi:TonB-dependent starch-binding outer membrane protein SusC